MILNGSAEPQNKINESNVLIKSMVFDIMWPQHGSFSLSHWLKCQNYLPVKEIGQKTNHVWRLVYNTTTLSYHEARSASSVYNSRQATPRQFSIHFLKRRTMETEHQWPELYNTIAFSNRTKQPSLYVVHKSYTCLLLLPSTSSKS